MLDRSDALILGRCSATDGDQRLAGGIRHKVKVKIIPVQGRTVLPKSFFRRL